MTDSTRSSFKDVLSKVRHDLRTPVGHIIGYSEMLEEELEESPWPEFEADLKHIRSSGEHLIELIDEFLGPEKQSPDELDIPYIQEQFRTQLNHISGYSEILEELTVECDRLKLLPDLQKVGGAARSLLRLIEERLTVSTFDGLDRDFSRTCEEESSPPGKTQDIVPIGSTGLGEGGEILIVDDDESNRELLRRRLLRHGYSVSTCPDGESALEHLRSNPVDVVLLDMMMPGISGIEVLERLKNDKTLRNVPIIMLSALDDTDQIVKCILLGAEDYLFKPSNPVLLKARLSATLEKHRLRRQSALRLSVFISSPSDVTPERRAIKGVIARINEDLSGRVHLVPVMWEEEPLLASETAQTQIIAPRDTDFYMGIFWYRMGTMLPEHMTRPDGSRYGSGTEFEFEDAIAGHSEAGKPDILVYRKTADPVVSLTHRDHVLDCLEQKERLEKFLQSWFATSDGQSIARTYHAFESIDQFEGMVFNHLRKLVLKRLEQRD